MCYEPDPRPRRHRGDIEAFVLGSVILLVVVIFGFITWAIVQGIQDDDQNNRQSCLQRNGSILEDAAGHMTGCIIDRERP